PPAFYPLSLTRRSSDLSTGFQMTSPGFEINDVGFLSRASQKNQYLWWQYRQTKPRSFFRFWNFNVNEWKNYTWDNVRSELGGNRSEEHTSELQSLRHLV